MSRTSPLSLRNSPSKRFLEGVLKGRLVHLTVRIAPLFQAPGPARVGAGQVTFEPGAHTAWHTLSSVRLLTFRSVVQVGQRKVLWLCSPGASYVVGPAPPGFSASRIDACKSVRVLVLVHEDMIEAPSDLLREHGIRHQRTPTARTQVEAFAAEHRLQIVAWYVENESGAKLARPELFRLLADAHEGDGLLVEQIDRLSRLCTARTPTTAATWRR